MWKRFFYEKTGKMKYLAHLDFLNFIERIFKMAEIEMNYSNGFHPRPRFSFGYPLTIGTEADMEPFDADLKDDLGEKELIARLNEILPEGLRILKVVSLDKKSVIVDDYDLVEYEVKFGNNELLNTVVELLNRDEIVIEKEKRGKITRRDLKAKIDSFKVEGNKIILLLNEISPAVILKQASEETDYTMKRTRYVKL